MQSTLKEPKHSADKSNYLHDDVLNILKHIQSKFICNKQSRSLGISF